MSNPTLQIYPEQAERLKELGYHLHQFRQNQRRSLEEVAAQTLIPVRILAAIEAGDVHQLPEPVYVQGFIRRYADAIGIDGTEFASAFSTQPNTHAPKASWRGTVQAQLRPLHLYLLYMVLVFGAVSGLSYLLNRSSPQLPGLVDTAQSPQSDANGPKLPSGPVVGPVLPTEIGAGAQSSTLTVPPSISQKSVRVGLTLTAQSWIRIVADGKTAFEGVLPEGAQRTWEANKEVVVRAGNAGGVMVSYNDAQAKRLGEPGAVEEKTFSANPATASQPTKNEPTLAASNPNSF